MGADGELSPIDVRSTFGRFAVVPVALLHAKDVSDRAVRLWQILYIYVNPALDARPSRGVLARQLGCSIDTVDRAVRELEEKAWLTVERFPPVDDRSERNVYHPLTREEGRPA